MRLFERVYKSDGKTLVPNCENKVSYKDSSGRKRVKTNPTYKDFSSVGFLPRRKISYLTKENHTEQIEKRNDCYVVSVPVMEVK